MSLYDLCDLVTIDVIATYLLFLLFDLSGVATLSGTLYNIYNSSVQGTNAFETLKLATSLCLMITTSGNQSILPYSVHT